MVCSLASISYLPVEGLDGRFSYSSPSATSPKRLVYCLEGMQPGIILAGKERNADDASKFIEALT